MTSIREHEEGVTLVGSFIRQSRLNKSQKSASALPSVLFLVYKSQFRSAKTMTSSHKGMLRSQIIQKDQLEEFHYISIMNMFSMYFFR